MPMGLADDRMSLAYCSRAEWNLARYVSIMFWR